MLRVSRVVTVANEDQTTMYPQEFLNSLNLSGLPPHALYIKKNTPIMFLRNFDTDNGHCNGTRYIVKHVYSEKIIEAEIMAEEYKGSRQLIPRIILSPSDSAFPFIMKRKQFPIRAAFVWQLIDFKGIVWQKQAYI